MAVRRIGCWTRRGGASLAAMVQRCICVVAVSPGAYRPDRGRVDGYPPDHTARPYGVGCERVRCMFCGRIASRPRCTLWNDALRQARSHAFLVVDCMRNGCDSPQGIARVANQHLGHDRQASATREVHGVRGTGAAIGRDAMVSQWAEISCPATKTSTSRRNRAALGGFLDPSVADRPTHRFVPDNSLENGRQRIVLVVLPGFGSQFDPRKTVGQGRLEPPCGFPASK